MKKVILIFVMCLGFTLEPNQFLAGVNVYTVDRDKVTVVTHSGNRSGNNERSGFQDYRSNYQEGYKEGYTYNAGGVRGILPVPPVPPVPNAGESEKDGYTRGILEGQRAKQRDRW